MNCAAYLYDDATPKQAPIPHSHLVLFMTNSIGVLLVSMNSSRHGPSEYGAVLTTTGTAEPYQVFVDDPGGPGHSATYAPASFGDLNGGVTGRLDVTLYPLPASGSGGGSAPSSGGQASTPRAIQTWIDAQVQRGIWKPAEGLAVLSLVSTTQRAILAPAWDRQLAPALERWIMTCRALGIRLD